MSAHRVNRIASDVEVLVDSSVSGRLHIVISSRPTQPILPGILAIAFAAALYCVTVAAVGTLIAAALGIALATVGFFSGFLLLLSREEYLVNSADRSIRQLRHSRLRTAETIVAAGDVTSARLIRTSEDWGYAYHLQLLVDGGHVRLCLPAEIKISASDCRRVAHAFDSMLRVPLQDDHPRDE